MIKNLPGIFGYEDMVIKVYDPEKKECIAIYRNFNEAGNRLGMLPVRVQQACKTKTRKFSPLLNKEVALRVARKPQT